MEALRTERNFLRKQIDTIHDAYQKGEPFSRDSLQDKATRLFDLDAEIKRLLTETEVSEEEYLQELEGIEAYRDKFISTSENVKAAAESEYASVENATGATPKVHKKKKLPKLELFVFDGKLENWIQFWGSFKSIHEDMEITDDEKFQYLLQATSGDAKNFIRKYPPSAENYDKALQQLKGRFAKPSLLIDFYIREMLEILIRELTNCKKSDVKTLYDQITANLNNLESLGRATKKYAAVLVPMIESIIPSKILDKSIYREFLEEKF